MLGRNRAAALPRNVIHVAGALLLLSWLVPAQGQVFESIDRRRVENGIELTFVFSSPVQYLRHTPLTTGRQLRIFVRLTPIGLQPIDLLPATRRLPRTNGDPEVIARFPDMTNALEINFDREVSYIVQQGPDGRSIRVRLDLSPAK